jgi:hypothetical protein
LVAIATATIGIPQVSRPLASRDNGGIATDNSFCPRRPYGDDAGDVAHNDQALEAYRDSDSRFKRKLPKKNDS